MQSTAKVSIAGGVAGSLTVILVWIIGQFHIQVPAEVASAITTVIAFAASWQCHAIHQIFGSDASGPKKDGPKP